MYVNGIVGYCYIFVMFTQVTSQVCTKLKATATSEELIRFSGNVVTKRKHNSTFLTSIVFECCRGYKKRVEEFAPSSANCVTACELQCENGRCSKQNICECYEGYQKHATHNSCVLKDRYANHSYGVCDPPCGNGYCTPEQYCVCDDDFIVDAYKNPQCTPYCRLCRNSACVAPGRCTCPHPYTPTYLTTDLKSCSCSDDCDENCDFMVCLGNSTYKHNTMLTNERSNSITLYISVVANVTLLIIIAIFAALIVKRRRGVEHGNINTRYIDMGVTRQNDCQSPPQSDFVVGNLADEYVPIYDYVETPLAFHVSKSHVAAGARPAGRRD